MKTINKSLLALGTVAAIAAPMAAVVSCSLTNSGYVASFEIDETIKTKISVRVKLDGVKKIKDGVNSASTLSTEDARDYRDHFVRELSPLFKGADSSNDTYAAITTIEFLDYSDSSLLYTKTLSDLKDLVNMYDDNTANTLRYFSGNPMWLPGTNSSTLFAFMDKLSGATASANTLARTSFGALMTDAPSLIAALILQDWIGVNLTGLVSS